MKHRDKMTILALIFGPFVYFVYSIKLFFIFLFIGWIMGTLWISLPFLFPVIRSIPPETIMAFFNKFYLNLYIIKVNPFQLIIHLIIVFDIRRRAIKEEQMQEKAKQQRLKRYDEIRRLTRKK